MLNDATNNPVALAIVIAAVAFAYVFCEIPF
jgi:hypothetical protein